MKKIVQKGDKVLRDIAKEVPISEIQSKKIQKILKDMSSSLEKKDNGVAIAAPQIGQSLRIFIVSKKVFPKNPEKDIVFINPEIISKSKDKDWMDEGCLSVEDYFGQVQRHKKVKIRAYNEKGELFQRGGSELLAQIFQHEIDHLNGTLFIDKAKNVKKYIPKENEE